MKTLEITEYPPTDSINLLTNTSHTLSSPLLQTQQSMLLFKANSSSCALDSIFSLDAQGQCSYSFPPPSCIIK